MSACITILTEETNGLGQRALKGSTREYLLFDSCFSSNKSVEAAVYIGVYLIYMVKTNIRGFCRAVIEGLTKYWPGGSCIVLRTNPMVPG